MISYFTKHPTASNLLMLLLIVIGILAVPKLQRDTFPVIPATEIEIKVIYPGATATDVEQAICPTVEDVLEAITNLWEIRCDARENIGIITAQKTESGDLDAFYNDVKSAIDSINTFPSKVDPPSVVLLERTASVASIAISTQKGAKIADDSLRQYAEKVRQRISQDRRIALVKMRGFSDREIVILIKNATLQKYSLTFSDISNAIKTQSISLPVGSLETEQGRILIRYDEQRKSLDEFSNIVIFSGERGALVRLGDIAKIEYQFEKEEEKILFNGQRAVLLDIIKTIDQDSLRVMDAVKENLQKEIKRAPKGLKLGISQDVTNNIKDRLRILVSNGAMGLVLVFFTMWAFFSFKFSFWVTMGLPVSFLATIYLMNLLGYTINMITMVALLVAIGLLMDDAIIISENIAAQIKKGKNALDAAIDGVKQVLPGVFSSFLTTIMIVGPLFFMAGKMGAVMKYLPAVLVLTLAVSLVEAFLILPAHLYHSLSHMEKQPRSRFHIWFERKFENLRDKLFVPLVSWVTKKPYIAIGSMILLLLISVSTITSGKLKFMAFPKMESDIIQARILLPQGTPLEKTEELVQQVIKGLSALNIAYAPQQKSAQNLVKNTTVLYNTNIDAKESGTHIATISADLIRAEHRSGSIDEILLDWRELTGELEDAITIKYTDKERGIAGKAVDIRLQGENIIQLQKASLELQNYLRGFKGVIEVSDDLRPGKPEISIHLKDEANMLGVSSAQISSEVRAAMQGSLDLEVQLKTETNSVIVRLAEPDRNEFNDLQYLSIRTKSGDLIPLHTVAVLTQTRGLSRIHRINGRKTITVQGTINTKQVNASELMKRIKKEFLPDLKSAYPSVKPSFQGQGKESSTTGISLIVNILIGLFGVYIILSFQFKSYVQPVAVMLSIPMGLVGVVWGHIALGLDLSIPSIVGLATLAGIVVNDNILLVTFIKERLAEGQTIFVAVNSAAKARFRAIILTSLTTIAGLLPLLTETSTQAQLLIPIVASLVFGLFTATLFSILLVPAFFVILEQWSLKKIS